MFNGNDQFHHFVASRTSLPIPLSTFPSFPAGFDPYRSSPQHMQHQSQPLNTDEQKQQQPHLVTVNDETDNKSTDHCWSSDEVFLLQKVRSSMENWFPDFSWEHVSRKLGELGFKRSAEQCKEKFEEQESRNVSYNKNYRVFTELDAFYPGGNQEESRVSSERVDNDQEIQKQKGEAPEEMNMEENSENVAIPCEEMSEEVVKQVKSNKKRKRKERFEMLKGFCVEIVNKLMARQEELHNKLIEDIAKRDKEIIAREEAWKNEEMERSKLEIEKWAQEQAIATERQTIIIEVLKKFTSENSLEFANQIGSLVPNASILPITPTENTLPLDTTPPAFRSKFEPIRKMRERTDETLSTSAPLILQNQEAFIKTPSSNPTPSSIVATKDSSKANSYSNPSSDYDDKKGDIGMRWPRDQVLALINLRCQYGNGTASNSDEATIKAPLWEKISLGMMELGYNRSSKRCKEKWENINKYYRKTKDSNKKRTIESRTCPYFHELSRLYSEGTIIAPTNDS